MGDKERAENQSSEAENPIWEYWLCILQAHLDNKGVREYLRENHPEIKNLPVCAPPTMIPEMNRLGTEGWELVHMQPVYAGQNGDIMHGTGGGSFYSSEYFCVFKRKSVQK